MSPPSSPPADRIQRLNGRRLAVLAGLVVVVAAIVIVAIVGSGSGSGSSRPHYVPPGPGGQASTLAPAKPGSLPGPATSTDFQPAPAAAALAAQLPLARQVAQLFLVSVDGTSPEAVGALGTADWGGVVLDWSNFSTDKGVGQLIAALRSGAFHPGRAPMLMAATQEGGAQTAIPDLPPQSEAQIGANGTPATAQSEAVQAAQRLRALGVNMTLAPLADVDIPQGALTGRLFSTDPKAVAQFTAAALSGYLSQGMISAISHFPGSGAASADPDQMTANVGGSLTALEDNDLIPFAAVTQRAPVIVMSNAAYVAFDGVTPAGLLPGAVRLLRHDYGFDGVVMSDDLDATLQPTGQSPAQVALQALEAGDDLLYITGPASEHQAAYQAVLSAAETQPAVRADVRTALLRDLTLKARFGVLR